MKKSKLKCQKLKLQKGQSLFEVVVALAISTLIIVAVVSLASNSIRNSTYSKNKTLAASYAQEAMEWLRNQRDSNTAGFFASVQTSPWCLAILSFDTPGACVSGQVIADTPFSREVSFSTTTLNSKTVLEASVKVYWNDSQGYHEVVNNTDFTDWRQR